MTVKGEFRRMIKGNSKMKFLQQAQRTTQPDWSDSEDYRKKCCQKDKIDGSVDNFESTERRLESSKKRTQKTKQANNKKDNYKPQGKHRTVPQRR